MVYKSFYIMAFNPEWNTFAAKPSNIKEYDIIRIITINYMVEMYNWNM